jgi:hypothetical protein
LTIFLSQILLPVFCALFSGIDPQTPENFPDCGYFLITEENRIFETDQRIDANPNRIEAGIGGSGGFGMAFCAPLARQMTITSPSP